MGLFRPGSLGELFDGGKQVGDFITRAEQPISGDGDQEFCRCHRIQSGQVGLRRAAWAIIRLIAPIVGRQRLETADAEPLAGPFGHATSLWTTKLKSAFLSAQVVSDQCECGSDSATLSPQGGCIRITSSVKRIELGLCGSDSATFSGTWNLRWHNPNPLRAVLRLSEERMHRWTPQRSLFWLMRQSVRAGNSLESAHCEGADSALPNQRPRRRRAVHRRGLGRRRSMSDDRCCTSPSTLRDVAPAS